MKWLTITRLCKKYNFNRVRLWRWIQKGWVKAKREEQKISFETGRKKRYLINQRMSVWLVDEDSFLKIPPFIRKGRKK